MSTAQQATGGVSLAAQQRQIELYAELRALPLVGVELDTASASSLDRPGLRRALAALDRGDVDALVVAKLDRLTRSVRDLGVLVTGPGCRADSCNRIR